MDNHHHNTLLNWAYYCHGKSMEELRESLMYTTLELEQTKVAVEEELRKKDDQLLSLKDLLNKTIMERDQAQEKCHKLLLEKLLFQQQQIAPVSGISNIEDDPRRGNDSNNGLSSSDCEESIVSSPMFELTPENPLPEKGKLLQAVMKAGPLLQTLLLAGPLPQWRHPPPPLESFHIPPVTMPSPPPTAPQLLHKDSFLNTNGCSSSVATNCGRDSRKRVFCDGSDSPTETKYQRVVLH
ncbi:hypothetical protein TanjilG_30183 [Lupinus angustifolius]|uniref:Uncharacterized protein n=1 Tax=Lupinus angustifolius TaxID=3871 RepID=A0A4P1R6P1_LUPAN|nr:PREDICTED: uncharacterized protein LOC109358521 [Lupinus angustifolius]OIW03907.1 hypothetical protein TanjilG_30183 [Lupinus angustifolius]